MAESHLNTKKIAPEELKSKRTNEQMHQIGNFPPEDLDKDLQKFYVEVCNFVMPIINK